jgi:hypothetical protein
MVHRGRSGPVDSEYETRLPPDTKEYLLLRILEVPGSNLCQETGYPDRGFPWFFSVPPFK